MEASIQAQGGYNNSLRRAKLEKKFVQPNAIEIQVSVYDEASRSKAMKYTRQC